MTYLDYAMCTGCRKADVATQEQRRITEASRSARREGRTRTAVVYYLRLDAERIKIGFTSRLETRLRDLRAAPGALLAVEPGGKDLEKERHHQFRAERINTQREDFAASQRLLDWTDEVRRTHPQPKQKPDTRTVTVRKQAS